MQFFASPSIQGWEVEPISLPLETEWALSLGQQNARSKAELVLSLELV